MRKWFGRQCEGIGSVDDDLSFMTGARGRSTRRYRRVERERVHASRRPHLTSQKSPRAWAACRVEAGTPCCRDSGSAVDDVRVEVRPRDSVPPDPRDADRTRRDRPDRVGGRGAGFSVAGAARTSKLAERVQPRRARRVWYSCTLSSELGARNAGLLPGPRSRHDGAPPDERIDGRVCGLPVSISCNSESKNYDM